MSKITVSISIPGHDRSITILEDQKVKAILQEDRFSRIKNDTGKFLICLEKLTQLVNKIDHLIIYNTLEQDASYISNYLTKKGITINSTYHFPLSDHHLGHAASGFYGSGFNEAICLSIDGYGGTTTLPDEDFKGRYTTRIYKASYPYTFEEKYSNVWYDSNHTLKFSPNIIKDNHDYNEDLDIGFIFYAIGNFIGFPHQSDAGKVMGLSSYGKPNPKLPSILYQDTIYGNSNLFSSEGGIKLKINPYLQNIDKEISKDLAFSVQKSLEKVFIKRVEQALSYSDTDNLVLSGGCFMNVIGNYLIKKHFPNINLYVDPLSTDSGLSYGISKLVYHQGTDSIERDPLKHLYWGPRYSNNDLLNSIQKYEKL